ncbi:hypothetical protein VU08_04360 [Desulfobulbus sp. F5]|nr:hypothetical protein [Desulfobulbus sp. F5]
MADVNREAGMDEKGLDHGAETLAVEVGGRTVQARCELSRRHRKIIAAGGLLNWPR